MRGRLLLALLAVITIAPRASAAEMIPAQAFEPMLLAPVVVTVLAIIPLYRWLLPSQLGSLQVAFETQDDLYEVHRLTLEVGGPLVICSHCLGFPSRWLHTSWRWLGSSS